MDFGLISSVFEMLRITPPPKLTLLEAQSLASAHYPPFPPDMPALLTGIDSRDLALQVEKVLLAIYPRGHEVTIVEGQASRTEQLVNFQPSTFNFQPVFTFHLLAKGHPLRRLPKSLRTCVHLMVVRGTKSRLTKPCGLICLKKPTKH